MKILIYSHAFYPSVGGSETACRVLCDGLVSAGHQVRLVTQTAGPSENPFAYPITRLPSFLELLRLLRWCDVYVHSNVSLHGALPLLLARKPWVIVHHSRITRLNGDLIWIDHLKRFMLRFATNISVSRSMAASLPVPSAVLGNGYDDLLFHLRPEIPRERDVMFLGRLNHDKGAHLAVDALRLLKERSLRPTLSIVGMGGEEENLRRQVREAGLEGQVVFTGKKEGREIGVLLNRHRILVVPSLVAETFGLVVMEGLASGCGVVVSDMGALKETVGPCGLNFPSGDAAALADRIEKMLTQPELIEDHQAHAPAHLRPFRRENSLKAYQAIIETAAGGAGFASAADVLLAPNTF